MCRAAVVPHVVVQHGARHLQREGLRLAHGGGPPFLG
jgi:hypothetical protein